MRYSDSHSKWISGVFGIGIIGLLSFFATRDRISIDNDIRSLRQKNDELSVAVGILSRDEAIAKIQYEYLMASVHEMNIRHEEVNSKLNRVLTEVKR